MITSVVANETRTVAAGLGFPALTGLPTSPLGWPGADTVSRETPGSGSNRAAEREPSERDNGEMASTAAGTTEDVTEELRPHDSGDRAEIAAALPGADEQTPLARAVADDVR